MKEEILNNNDAQLFCNTIELGDFNNIQPYGVLLVIDFDLSVTHYSENITSFFDVTIEELLNHPISNFLKLVNSNDSLSACLNSEDKKYHQMLWQTKTGITPILVYINRTADNIILEIEHGLESQIDEDDLFNLTQLATLSLKIIDACNNVTEIAQKTCEEIKKITAYNRVLIYKFDEIDHSGNVIGEVVDKGIDSYISLRFPASDIPKNVRSMYLEQSLRYIPSCEQTPIKIIANNSKVVKKNSFDISHINLRMVAPVHVQYLKNMNVSAAVSVAIIQNNKLWGLIACHHQKEKVLSLNIRLTLLQMANTVAAKIWAMESNADYSNEQKKVALQSSLTLSFGKKDALVHGLELYHKVMMDLVSASGLSHFFQGVLINYGETPENKQIINLVSWLKTQNYPEIYCTAKLPEVYSDSLSYKEKACGLLAVKIPAIEDHYLLFYKPEKVQTVQWAGNPNKVLKCTRSIYSPRDSFERFLQTTNNLSDPWDESDTNFAKSIQSIVTNWQLQDLLLSQVTHDPLTGLLNRLLLEPRLVLEIKRASQNKTNLAVILIDLDLFKNVNDKYGHQAGDTVLIEFAKILNLSFRKDDTVYRYGGEEFLIILPDINSNDAYQMAENLRKRIKKNLINYNHHKISITISLGVSIYPENGMDAKSIISAADDALYQAKQDGRDQVFSLRKD